MNIYSYGWWLRKCFCQKWKMTKYCLMLQLHLKMKLLVAYWLRRIPHNWNCKVRRPLYHVIPSFCSCLLALCSSRHPIKAKCTKTNLSLGKCCLLKVFIIRSQILDPIVIWGIQFFSLNLTFAFETLHTLILLLQVQLFEFKLLLLLSAHSKHLTHHSVSFPQVPQAFYFNFIVSSLCLWLYLYQYTL